MKAFTQFDVYELLCKQENKCGLYFYLYDDTEEVEYDVGLAIPFFTVEMNAQAFLDGECFFLFDTPEEFAKAYNNINHDICNVRTIFPSLEMQEQATEAVYKQNLISRGR